jgi:hypothetical protein
MIWELRWLLYPVLLGKEGKNAADSGMGDRRGGGGLAQRRDTTKGYAVRVWMVCVRVREEMMPGAAGCGHQRRGVRAWRDPAHKP